MSDIEYGTQISMNTILKSVEHLICCMGAIGTTRNGATTSGIQGTSCNTALRRRRNWASISLRGFCQERVM